MAQFSKGVLGGFSGKVGTVIGSNWKGIDCIRSLPAKKKNRQFSQKQLEQQAKFAIVTQFLSSFNTLLMESFQRPVKGMTNINDSVSDVLKRSITGNYPNYSIAFEQVLLTQGRLPNVNNPAATAGTTGKINFTWTDNQGIGKATGDDQSLLIVYCQELDTVVYRKSGSRDVGTDVIDVSLFSGKQVHTWIAFLSADGKDLSNSLHTGMVTVV